MKTVKIYMVRKPFDIDEVMELCRRYNAQAEEVTVAETVNLPPVYYHAGRTLTQIETLLKKAYGNPLPVRPRDRLNRLQFKLEQMTARYKQSQEDLKAEYQARKSSESKNA